MDTTDTMTPPARLALFGFKPAAADVKVVRRSEGWRVSRAIGSLAVAWLLAPIAFILPPHFPWALAAIGTGIYLFFKYWTQKYTVLEFRGDCPKCAAAQKLDLPTKLRMPHPLTCEGCQQDLLLEVETARV